MPPPPAVDCASFSSLRCTSERSCCAAIRRTASRAALSSAAASAAAALGGAAIGVAAAEGAPLAAAAGAAGAAGAGAAIARAVSHSASPSCLAPFALARLGWLSSCQSGESAAGPRSGAASGARPLSQRRSRGCGSHLSSCGGTRTASDARAKVMPEGGTSLEAAAGVSASASTGTRGSALSAASTTERLSCSPMKHSTAGGGATADSADADPAPRSPPRSPPRLPPRWCCCCCGGGREGLAAAPPASAPLPTCRREICCGSRRYARATAPSGSAPAAAAAATEAAR